MKIGAVRSALVHVLDELACTSHYPRRGQQNYVTDDRMGDMRGRARQTERVAYTDTPAACTVRRGVTG